MTNIDLRQRPAHARRQRRLDVAAIAVIGALATTLVWLFTNPESITVGAPTTLDRIQAQIAGTPLPSDEPTPTDSTIPNPNRDINAMMAFVNANPANLPGRSYTGKGYKFMFARHRASAIPAHWCPTTPITWHLDTTTAKAAGRNPKDEQTRWRDAFQQWSDASGGAYTFRQGRNLPSTLTMGRTLATINEADIPDNSIAITYATDSRADIPHRKVPITATLTGRQAVGGAYPPAPISDGQTSVIKHGFIIVNAGSPDPINQKMYVHELGHALGLTHVNSPTEVMFEEARGPSTPQSGDQRGIRALAGLGCF